LAKILKEEYGIEPAAAAVAVAGLLPVEPKVLKLKKNQLFQYL